ncbi:hypothetical protein [Lactimicrobium sp.]|uniref:hypothetical protein n=2 Tax=Lactimicrobium sp. TaxID=2563780 RepID=UPI002F36045B
MNQFFNNRTFSAASDDPMPSVEGGLGKPLGHKNGNNLYGFLKIKLIRAGIRVVYQLKREEDTMLVIIIGMRSDDEVYEIASRRINKYRL